MKLIKLIALLLYTTVVIAISMFAGMHKSDNGADERAEIRIAKKVGIAANVNKPVMISTSKFQCTPFQVSIAGMGGDGRYQDFGK